MKKFYRSQKDKKIAGLCGGLGEFWAVDPTLIRLGLILLGFMTGIAPVIIVYIVGWIIVLEAPARQGKKKTE